MEGHHKKSSKDNEEEYKKDIEEYISDCDSDGIESSTSESSNSSQSSTYYTDENEIYWEMTKSFVKTWETFMNDLLAMKDEGMIEENGALAEMMDAITSMEKYIWPELNNNIFTPDEGIFPLTDLLLYDDTINEARESSEIVEKEELVITYDDFYNTKEEESSHDTTEDETEVQDHGKEHQIHVEEEDTFAEKEFTDIHAEENSLINETIKTGNGKGISREDGLKIKYNGEGNESTFFELVDESVSFKKQDETLEDAYHNYIGNEILDSTLKMSSKDDDFNVSEASDTTDENKDIEEMEKLTERTEDDVQYQIDEKYKTEGRENNNLTDLSGYVEFLKERWYYEEIDGEKDQCNRKISAPIIKEELPKFPLTQQSKLERNYEIRKEKAWKKWLEEKDRDKRRKTLLELQRILSLSKKKKTVPACSKEKKKIDAELQGRLQREKEIAKRVALEKSWWKKQMEQRKKHWEEKEALTTKRRMQFLNLPLAQAMTGCAQSKIFKEKKYQPKPRKKKSSEIKLVAELPEINLSGIEIKEPRQDLPEKQPEKETSHDKDHEVFQDKVSKERKNIDEMINVNDDEILLDKPEIYEDWLFCRLKKSIKLFEVLEIPCLLAHQTNEFDWMERMKRHLLQKIKIAKFQVIPKIIIFKNFIPNVIYRKKITIRNVGIQSSRLCIVGLWYSDDSLNNLGILEFDESVGELPKIVYIKPGLTFEITLVFKPRSIADSTAVSAQIALLVAQGPLLAGRDAWAKANRASVPDKVKDAGYILVPVWCRNARPDPEVKRPVVILNNYPQTDEYERKALLKEITIVNKGTLGCHFSILRITDSERNKHISKIYNSIMTLQRCNHQFILEGTNLFLSYMQDEIGNKNKHRQVQGYWVMQINEADTNKIDDSSVKFEEIKPKKKSKNPKPFTFKKKVTPRGIFAKKLRVKSDTAEVKEIGDGVIIATETLERILDVVTSYFTYTPQFSGDLEPKSSTKMLVSLKKAEELAEKTNYTEKYVLCFRNNAKTPEIPIWICLRTCTVTEKITLSKKTIDFGVCRAGGIYQDYVEVYNHYGFPRGIILSINEKQAEELFYQVNFEIIPKGLSFVQPHSSFPFTIRMIVGKANNINNYKYNLETISKGELTIDAEVHIRNMESKIGENFSHITKTLLTNIKLSATLSDMAIDPKCLPLVLDPSEINLGVCVTTETLKFDFKLISNSKLTLTYGFLGLPKYVTVQPGFGFGHILAGETITLELLYSPLPEHGSASPGKVYTFQLFCYNLLNKATPKFTAPAKLTVTATIVHIPDLHLSSSVICFPATPCESFSKACINLATVQGNDSKEEKDKYSMQSKNVYYSKKLKRKENICYWFEIQPQSDEILVFPSHGYLLYGETLKLKLFFRPKLKKNVVKNKAKEMWKLYTERIAELEKENEMRENELEKNKKNKKGKDKKEINSQDDKNKTDKSKSKISKNMDKSSSANTSSLSRIMPQSSTGMSSKINMKDDNSKAQSQSTVMEDDEFSEEIMNFLLIAERRLLKTFEPYICTVKIICLVVKSYTLDGDAEISEDSEKKDLSVISSSLTQDRPSPLSRYCSSLKPPKDKQPNILLLEAVCPVVQPGFVILEYGEEWMKKVLDSEIDIKRYSTTDYEDEYGTNFKASYNKVVDFGAVAINGGSRILAMKLQNISMSSSISMFPASFLNPNGPFSCNFSHTLQLKENSRVSTINLPKKDPMKARTYSLEYASVLVPPEHILRIPVSFSPDTEGEVKEYIDIKGISDRGITTQMTVPLIGRGEMPKFTFQPNPPVVTLRQLKGKNAKPSVIKIENLCSAPLDFYIGKITPLIEQENSKNKTSKSKKADALPDEEHKNTSKNYKKERKNIENNGNSMKESERETTQHNDLQKIAKQQNTEFEIKDTSNLDYEIKKDELKEGNHDLEELNENDTEALKNQTVINVTPADFLRVDAFSKGDFNISLKLEMEKMQQSFTFPITLFGKGPNIADVIVKVIVK